MKVGDLVIWSRNATNRGVPVGDIAGIVLWTLPSRGNVEILDPTGVRVELQAHFLEVASESR